MDSARTSKVFGSQYNYPLFELVQIFVLVLVRVMYIVIVWSFEEGKIWNNNLFLTKSHVKSLYFSYKLGSFHNEIILTTSSNTLLFIFILYIFFKLWCTFLYLLDIAHKIVKKYKFRWIALIFILILCHHFTLLI